MSIIGQEQGMSTSGAVTKSAVHTTRNPLPPHVYCAERQVKSSGFRDPQSRISIVRVPEWDGITSILAPEDDLTFAAQTMERGVTRDDFDEVDTSIDANWRWDAVASSHALIV